MKDNNQICLTIKLIRKGLYLPLAFECPILLVFKCCSSKLIYLFVYTVAITISKSNRLIHYFFLCQSDTLFQGFVFDRFACEFVHTKYTIVSVLKTIFSLYVPSKPLMYLSRELLNFFIRRSNTVSTYG